MHTHSNLVFMDLQLLPQHYKPVSFKTLRQPYDTPTFKTNALCLVSEVQRV